MTTHSQDQDVEPDWVVVARAEGILSARHRIDIGDAVARLRCEARALGVPVEQHAEELTRSAGPPGQVATPRSSRRPRPRRTCLDLDEELALHRQLAGRRGEPPDLDAATEAALRRLMG